MQILEKQPDSDRKMQLSHGLKRWEGSLKLVQKVCLPQTLRRSICVDEGAGKWSEENVANLVCQSKEID